MRPLASDQRSGMTAQIQPPQTLKPLPTPDPEPEPHSQQRPALACEELRLELRLPANRADHAAAGDAPKDTAAGAARRQQLKGTLIVAGGVLWFTPDSTTIKMVDDDAAARVLVRSRNEAVPLFAFSPASIPGRKSRPCLCGAIRRCLLPANPVF